GAAVQEEPDDEEPGQSVGAEDVAVPEQCRVDGTEGEQPEVATLQHPPRGPFVEPRGALAREGLPDAVTEEEGEERIAATVDGDDRDGLPHRVEPGGPGAVRAGLGDLGPVEEPG